MGFVSLIFFRWKCIEFLHKHCQTGISKEICLCLIPVLQARWERKKIERRDWMFAETCVLDPAATYCLRPLQEIKAAVWRGALQLHGHVDTGSVTSCGVCLQGVHCAALAQKSPRSPGPCEMLFVPPACRSLSEGALGGGALASRANIRLRCDFWRSWVNGCGDCCGWRRLAIRSVRFPSRSVTYFVRFALIIGAVSLLWRREPAGQVLIQAKDTQLLKRLLFWTRLIALLISKEDGVLQSLETIYVVMRLLVAYLKNRAINTYD